MNKIWVLTCGGIPHAWHEDVFTLIKNIQSTFPDKKWKQLNDLVWEQIDGNWRVTSINKQEETK